MNVRTREALVGLLVLAGALVACGGEDGPAATGANDCARAAGSFELVAADVGFGVSCVEVQARTTTPFTLENRDALLHNLPVYVEEPTLPEDKAGPNLLFRSEDAAPGETLSSELPPLDPGDYFFRCDYHPTAMKGTLSVV